MYVTTYTFIEAATLTKPLEGHVNILEKPRQEETANYSQ